MSSISIRPAEPSDVAAVTGIYAQAVRHGTASFEIEPPHEQEMLRRFEALRAGGHPFLVSELDGQVVAYAYAGPFRLRAAFDWTVEDSIYVAPAAQRRGLGRKLLQALVEESQARGFRQMLAVIGDSANTPSIELHRAMGFRHIGTFSHVGFKFGRWLDSVLMQRALGLGADAPP